MLDRSVSASPTDMDRSANTPTKSVSSSPIEQDHLDMRRWIARQVDRSRRTTVIDDLVSDLAAAGWTHPVLVEFTTNHLRAWLLHDEAVRNRWQNLTRLAELTPGRAAPLATVSDLLLPKQITVHHLEAVAAGVPVKALQMIAQTLRARDGTIPLLLDGYQYGVWTAPRAAWHSIVDARPCDTEAELLRWLAIALRRSGQTARYLERPEKVTEGWDGIAGAALFCDAGYTPTETRALLTGCEGTGGTARRTALMRQIEMLLALA